mmetsp:Transcript_9439/g.26612  ORF Transcript_9439/g.26612 Transcript_9439/m.26612 type:complete len:373 (-) Transcript_9439:1120-2238(-)
MLLWRWRMTWRMSSVFTQGIARFIAESSSAISSSPLPSMSTSRKALSAWGSVNPSWSTVLATNSPISVPGARIACTSTPRAFSSASRVSATAMSLYRVAVHHLSSRACTCGLSSRACSSRLSLSSTPLRTFHWKRDFHISCPRQFLISTLSRSSSRRKLGDTIPRAAARSLIDTLPYSSVGSLMASWRTWASAGSKMQTRRNALAKSWNGSGCRMVPSPAALSINLIACVMVRKPRHKSRFLNVSRLLTGAIVSTPTWNSVMETTPSLLASRSSNIRCASRGLQISAATIAFSHSARSNSSLMSASMWLNASCTEPNCFSSRRRNSLRENCSSPLSNPDCTRMSPPRLFISSTFLVTFCSSFMPPVRLHDLP